jgi:hypothetical protein
LLPDLVNYVDHAVAEPRRWWRRTAGLRSGG